MRVLLFTSSFLPVVGGMEYVLHYLAEALLDAGVDVTVMARRQSKADNFAHRYRLIRYGLPFRGGHRFRVDHVSAYWQLRKLYRSKGIDVANIHSVSVPPLLSLRFLKARRIPVVMTPHGEDVQRVPEIGYGLRLTPKWDSIVRSHLAQADAVTAISSSIRQELPMIDATRIFNVPNGIDTKLFGRERSDFLQRQLGLQNGTLIILSVGRNHIKKGYEFGIRAMGELVRQRRDENWHYVLVGKGVSELKAVVEHLRLSDRVSLVEAVPPDKLCLCFNSSQIFFSPSVVEGLSLVSIEAMACGLPLVVTDVPGNEDIVRDNRCGVVVRNKDIYDMARGLRELITDTDRRKALAEIAFERSADYDWRAIAVKYLSVYEHVMEQHRLSLATTTGTGI